MRSEYVFAAAREISNRFLLCRVAAVSIRRLQAGSRQPCQTINQSLQMIAAAEVREQRSEHVIADGAQPVPAAETRQVEDPFIY